MASSIVRAPCAAVTSTSARSTSLPMAMEPADIDMGAVGDPRLQIAADLAHAILDIEFLFAVARPSERETSKRVGGFHSDQLVFVEEIVITPLVAEEQPVAARSLRRHALVQECTKRRDSGPGPDHDYRHRWVGGQAEALRLLNICLDPVPRLDAIGEECRGNAEAFAPFDVVAYRVHGQRDATGIGPERGGDRVEARLDGIQRLD